MTASVFKRLLVATIVGLVGILGAWYWWLERNSVAASTALFKEAAIGWGLNPEKFVAAGRRTLPNQPATRVWIYRNSLGVDEIQVTEAEGLVCWSRQRTEANTWAHLGCQQVSR